MKLKDYFIVLIFFTIIIFIPWMAFVWYIQPIDEKLICDTPNACVFRQTRFPNITKSQEIYIYPNLKLEFKEVYVVNSRKNLFELRGNNYIFLLNKEKLFSFPSCIDNRASSYCAEFSNNVVLEFERFKNNETKIFIHTSLAKKYNRFNFGLFIGFILWLGIAFTGFIETNHFKNFLKEKKLREKRERNYQKKRARKSTKKVTKTK